jgi:hypothetical protein
MDPAANTIEEATRRRAHERARAVRDFYTHLTAYVVINLAVFAANAILVAAGAIDVWFFYWLALVWGVGLVMNAAFTFGTDRLFGPEWEERKVRQYLERNK